VSLLVVQDANEIPTQEFTLSTEQRIHVKRMALWLYANDIQNSDTFEVNFYDDVGLLYTKAFTGADVKAAIGSNTYSHGKYFIDCENDLMIGPGVYTVELVQLTGYTANNFLAWARDWESTFDSTYGTIENDRSDPFYLRLYDLRGREVSK
jgi:hypothetical protein